MSFGWHMNRCRARAKHDHPIAECQLRMTYSAVFTGHHTLLLKSKCHAGPLDGLQRIAIPQTWNHIGLRFAWLDITRP